MIMIRSRDTDFKPQTAAEEKNKNKSNVPSGLMHLIETIFIKIRQKPELLEHVVLRVGDGDKEIREFFMFTTVAANINDPDTTGTRARKAAIECFKLVQDTDLSVFIADTTSFCTDVVTQHYALVYIHWVS